MSKQPEALRLAHWLERDGANCQAHIDAAEELRRLYEAHDWQHKMAGDRLRRIEKLEAVNQELLESLNKLVNAIGRMPSNSADGLADEARVLISKAEGQA